MKARPLHPSPSPGPADQHQTTPAPGSRSWASRRLALCVLLFVCWLGYLAFLVLTQPKTPSGRPLVLSRPQLLVSQLDVVARVEEGAGDEVTVEEVLYPPEGAPVQAGDKITVTNLAASRPPRISKEEQEPPADLAGPGSYLMPLKRVGDHYEVVPVPESPGYLPPPPTRAGPRIYPATPEALAQYHSVVSGSKGQRVEQSKSNQD